VVDLAWAVLETGAAAGLFDGSSSSSSRTTTTTSSSDRSTWDYHIASVMRLASTFGRLFGGSLVGGARLEPWRPHAQQFTSDALLKLLLVPAGVHVGHMYKQQQRGQVCVQPYHQQLLSELGVMPTEQQSGIAGADADVSSTGVACAALAFVADMRMTALRNSSGSNSSSSSSSNHAGVTGQPAATAAAEPGLSRLHELLLLLLLLLEYAALVSLADTYCLPYAMGVILGVCEQWWGESDSTGTGAAVPQLPALPDSKFFLQPLLQELAPAVLRNIRTASAAGSHTLAAYAAANGSDAAGAALAQSLGSTLRLLAALSHSPLLSGELLHGSFLFSSKLVMLSLADVRSLVPLHVVCSVGASIIETSLPAGTCRHPCVAAVLTCAHPHPHLTVCCMQRCGRQSCRQQFSSTRVKQQHWQRLL
jgi:hypothetical protein